MFLTEIFSILSVECPHTPCTRMPQSLKRYIHMVRLATTTTMFLLTGPRRLDSLQIVASPGNCPK